jgi:hypothetical protein
MHFINFETLALLSGRMMPLLFCSPQPPCLELFHGIFEVLLIRKIFRIIVPVKTCLRDIEYASGNSIVLLIHFETASRKRTKMRPLKSFLALCSLLFKDLDL